MFAFFNPLIISHVYAAHSNLAAVPVAAATDVIVTGIKIIAWPFHLFSAKKDPRFDQGHFYNNYQNKIYRYYGNIKSLDADSKTLTLPEKLSCTHCGRKGVMVCPSCKGTGSVYVGKKP